MLLPRKQANLTTDEWRSLAPPLICQASGCSLFSHTTNACSFYCTLDHVAKTTWQNRQTDRGDQSRFWESALSVGTRPGSRMYLADVRRRYEARRGCRARMLIQRKLQGRTAEPANRRRCARLGGLRRGGPDVACKRAGTSERRSQNPDGTASPSPSGKRDKKMASLGLSSLLPRHNGAGAPLVSPSVPVVWLQRKKQGILSHDRPSLRYGARSVMLSHSRASKMSAYVRSSAARRVLCALETALSICPNEPQLQLPSAPSARSSPQSKYMLLDADITPYFAYPRMLLASRGCWQRPQQLCRAHGTWQECQSTLELLTGGFARTHMLYKDAFSHIKSRVRETRPMRPLSGTGLDKPG